MDKKLVMDPNVIQKFKWGGTTQEWSDEAEKLSNQLETVEYINEVHEAELENDNKKQNT